MIGHLRSGSEYFGSLKMLRNAEVTSLPVLDFSGTMCKNFENTSIAVSKNLYPFLYLLRFCTSTRSHSQKSITLVTVYGLRGKCFRTGLCRVYASCFYNQDLSLCLVTLVFFAAACNLLSELNAAGWLGAKCMLLAMAYRFDTSSNVAKSGVVTLRSISSECLSWVRILASELYMIL
jgi:hypothetical protein